MWSSKKGRRGGQLHLQRRQCQYQHPHLRSLHDQVRQRWSRQWFVDRMKLAIDSSSLVLIIILQTRMILSLNAASPKQPTMPLSRHPHLLLVLRPFSLLVQARVRHLQALLQHHLEEPLVGTRMPCRRVQHRRLRWGTWAWVLEPWALRWACCRVELPELGAMWLSF